MAAQAEASMASAAGWGSRSGRSGESRRPESGECAHDRVKNRALVERFLQGFHCAQPTCRRKWVQGALVPAVPPPLMATIFTLEDSRRSRRRISKAIATGHEQVEQDDLHSFRRFTTPAGEGDAGRFGRCEVDLFTCFQHTGDTAVQNERKRGPSLSLLLYRARACAQRVLTHCYEDSGRDRPSRFEDAETSALGRAATSEPPPDRHGASAERRRSPHLQ